MVACSAPARRSTSMVMARPDRSTPSRGSPIDPFRQTVTPLISTSTWSASKAASVVPMAASTRPQLGSLPNSAVLSRLFRAQARPAVSASRTLAAFRTVIAMSLVEPSASASSCIARSVAAAVSAAVNSSAVGVTPLAPLAMAMTVSLVDRQPSESTRSKLTPVAARSAVSSTAGSTTASVVRTTSMVARLGASMPAPLAIPPMVHPCPVCTVVLGTESVVMIARAASGPPSADSAFAASVAPASNTSIGRRTPLSPGRGTATAIPPRPRAPATVQAFAPPELSTTALSRLPASTCRLQSTGAAGKRLVVKTAAAASSGPSLTTSATSGAPVDLSPAATPAARNPCGAVTVTIAPFRTRSAPRSQTSLRCSLLRHGRGSRSHPDQRQAGDLGQAESQVGALQRAAGGALGQVVHRGDHDEPAGVGVDRELQLHGVGAEHRRRRGPLALGQQVHERLVGVCLLVGGPRAVAVRTRGERRRAGGQDAPAHRHQGGREAHADRCARCLGQVLHHLRGVPVDPADAVGADRAHHLAAEQVGLGRLAGATGATGGDHDDVGLDQAGGQRRGHRQADRGRVAARDGDPPGAGQLL